MGGSKPFLGRVLMACSPLPSVFHPRCHSLSLSEFKGFIGKNPRVRKIFVRNSGAGNGCANFMGAWNFCFLSAGNLHVHKIPRFRGGGGILFFFWGGGADFIFMGEGIFLSFIGKHQVLHKTSVIYLGGGQTCNN